jgi:hypothetical protein
LAGSLKRELKSKYGVQPKMSHEYHELEILVDGRSVFCYSRAPQMPTVESLMAAIEASKAAGNVRDELTGEF